MNYKFSDRIGALKPSAIREILKISDPSIISLAAGNPAPDAFPVDDMQRIANDIFTNNASAALQYGTSEGYTPLRESTAERLHNKYGIGGENDDLVIMSGGQQGMELSCKCFVNEGDTIICESPSFIGSLNAFRSYRANLVGIPVEEDGMNIEALENALKTEKNVRLIYVIPTFQNPTGRVTSLEKRKAIYALAQKYDVMILEDNPYFELRYSGENVPAIKTLDTDGRVIYVGSYSKVLSPGIRIGFVCANKEIIQKIVVVKQVSDVHTNLFFQMIADRIIRECDIDGHIERVRGIYKAKRDRMVEGIRRHFGEKVKYEVPDGGLFLWLTLPDGYDGAELCKICKTMGVAAVPGSAFQIDERAISPCVRLNFSLPTFEQIDKGTELLGKAIVQYVK